MVHYNTLRRALKSLTEVPFNCQVLAPCCGLISLLLCEERYSRYTDVYSSSINSWWVPISVSSVGLNLRAGLGL